MAIQPQTELTQLMSYCKLRKSNLKQLLPNSRNKYPLNQKASLKLRLTLKVSSLNGNTFPIFPFHRNCQLYELFSTADDVSSPNGTHTTEESVNVGEQQPEEATVKDTASGTPSNQQSGIKA